MNQVDNYLVLCAKMSSKSKPRQLVESALTWLSPNKVPGTDRRAYNALPSKIRFRMEAAETILEDLLTELDP